MKLTDAILEQLTHSIGVYPRDSLILPAWAYGANGRVVVEVDGIPIDLHRHLHNILIRPLEPHERMWQQGEPGNVNPHLFTVVDGPQRPETECPSGHPYEGNEAPPNSRGYRCLTCMRDSRQPVGVAAANAEKTHCPRNHEYTTENTLVGADGKRRCRTCRRDKNREYMRNLRSIRKDAS